MDFLSMVGIAITKLPSKSQLITKIAIEAICDKSYLYLSQNKTTLCQMKCLLAFCIHSCTNFDHLLLLLFIYFKKIIFLLENFLHEVVEVVTTCEQFFHYQGLVCLLQLILSIMFCCRSFTHQES